MAASTGSDTSRREVRPPDPGAETRRTRVLALGNDLLADDAFGLRVVSALRRHASEATHNGALDVVETMESGFALLDHLLDVDRVIVVDTVQTGKVSPGTILTFTEGEVRCAPGASPHYTGLFETLALGRKLGLPVAGEVSIVAVEADNCLTIGGAMTGAVADAVPAVCEIIERMVR